MEEDYSTSLRTLSNSMVHGLPFSPSTVSRLNELLISAKLNRAFDMPFLIGRVLAVTEHGRLCPVPERAQIGDRLAVMTGGAVPYLVWAELTIREETVVGYYVIGEYRVTTYLHTLHALTM